MSPRDPLLRHTLQWLIAGTRGGDNRARILLVIRDEPMNANQLSNTLGLHYRTIRHHLEVLEEHDLIVSVGEKYGVMYFLSEALRDNWDDFGDILGEIGKTLNKGED